MCICTRPLRRVMDKCCHAIGCKVCGCYLVTFLTQAPVFDCFDSGGSKNKHHESTCLKEMGLHLQIELLRTQ